LKKLATSLLVAQLLAGTLMPSYTVAAQAKTDSCAPELIAMTEAQNNNLAASMQRVGIDIFKELSAKKPEVNCFISPASIGICLQLVLAGANGQTKADMCKAMHLSEKELRADGMKNLMHDLKTDDAKVTLEIANAVFADKRLTLKDSFVLSARENFDSEMATEDFHSPSALAHINSWVDKKTHGHITSLTSKLPAASDAVLLNAVYFFGKWTKPFDVQRTEEGDFHRADSTSKKLPMMHSSGKFQYLENELFQAVELPYGGGRYQALIFLPKPAVKLAQLRSNISSENWTQWLQSFSTKSGALQLPRYKMEFGSSLKQVLAQLGFGNMFSGAADFSGMNTPPPALYVADVIHKTTLSVDEEGTVATAVTGAIFAARAMRREEPPFQMIVDRPFIFAIQDTATNLPLFLGAVYDPDAADKPE